MECRRPADGEISSPTWRQSLYTALMRSSLAALHNLDLHYQLVQQGPNVKEDESDSVAGPRDIPVRGVLALVLKDKPSLDRCLNVQIL